MQNNATPRAVEAAELDISNAATSTLQQLIYI